MASIKVKFRESKIEGNEGVVYYQIIHDRVVRRISTDYRLYDCEWNRESEKIEVHPSNSKRECYTSAIKDRIKLDVSRLCCIVESLDKQRNSYTVDDIVDIFQRELNGQTLFVFMQGVISRLHELHKVRTAETYTAALNSFMKFRDGADILLSNITSDVMIGYEAYLKHKGIIMNTISFYTRILRAVYNRAVEQEIIEQRYPFRHVYTGVDKTIKRALSLKCIKQIKEADFTMNNNMGFARDMFLFSFYTRGMSFVDMAYLRKKDLSNGVLTYRRRKTGQQLHIKWEKCMQAILDRYPTNKTQYLLPIINEEVADERYFYQQTLARVNRYLKKMVNTIDLQTPITMYSARHSWASIARSKNIPISVISEGMGHDSEATTQIYLASLDTAIVDRANSMILKLLK